MPVVVPEIEKQKARDEELRAEAPGRAGAAASDAAGPGHAAAAAADALLRRHGPQRRPQGRVDAAAGRARCGRRRRRRRSPRPRLRKTTSSSPGRRPPGLPKPVHKGTAARRRGAARREAAASRRPPVPSARRQARRRRPRRQTTKTTTRSPTPVAPPPAPVPPPPAPVETPPRRLSPAPPPAPVATGAIAAPGAAVAGETPSPTLLNSRSLTGFPSATVGYSVYEVAPPQQPAPPPLQPGAVPALPRRVTTPTPVVTTTLARCEGRFRRRCGATSSAPS